MPVDWARYACVVRQTLPRICIGAKSIPPSLPRRRHVPQCRAGPPGRQTFAHLQTTLLMETPSVLSFSESGLCEALLPREPLPGCLTARLLTLAAPLIDEELVALLAAALEAAHGVAANVVTAPVVQAALVYV